MKHVLALIILAVIGLPLLAACDGEGNVSGSEASSDPADVIEGYVTAYNAHDIDGAMAFFAEDAVIIQGTDRFVGADAIRDAVLGEFEIHAPGGDAYSMSNLAITENTATWDHLFKGVAHTCTGTGNQAVIDSGLIVTWTFAFIECD